MSAYRHQKQAMIVATVRSPVRAETIQVTLAAHGIVAEYQPRATGVPPVDFVEGHDILVGPGDEAAARDIIRRLGLDDEEGDEEG